MALETVVFPQGLFSGNMKSWSYHSENVNEKNIPKLEPYFDEVHFHEVFEASSSPSVKNGSSDQVAGSRKRRLKSTKNKQEVENQRMTHIAVERNRRKLMNEYLSILRSLMPASYAQRGDQASIVGGAMNYVKELEQLVQSLEAHKRTKDGLTNSPPFSNFFTFPQYTSTAKAMKNNIEGSNEANIADIEVTMVENNANLRILSKGRPKQLLKMVMGLQSLRLTTLHLNMTSTSDQMVLYSFSLKVEDDCGLSTVDDIATVVHQIIETINKESNCN
ncbi:hypothetical protein LUZ60_002659 [Juncus effusus]|nr:hypothetical protein LUZ60_002659 [Juncus effusus]